MAILMAAKSNSVDILGVTVSNGNRSLEQCLKNALMTLEIAGNDAPVFPGAETSLSGINKDCYSVYGEDGMGDQDLIHPTRKPETKSAYDFIAESINENPGEIEIICLGSVTNIAHVYLKYPNVLNNVKRIWVMGTAGFGRGNATPVAEFNAFKDPEALQFLYEAEWPMTIIGLDVCSSFITEKQLKKMSKGSSVQSFAAKANYGFLEFNKKFNNLNVINLCDQTAMACLLWENDYITESVFM